MIFTETALPGAFLIRPERHEDERGYFARTWCAREFLERGLEPRLVQCSHSHNARKGTIRGLHYQVPPMEETKLIRCTAGSLFDVIVDLRPGSATFLRWTSAELTPENGLMLYVPRGFAHGFETLADDTDVSYQMSEFYAPEHQRGLRWNDPAIGISWPLPAAAISDRDRTLPELALRGAAAQVVP
jgi:dTDP-4-dehydrorhamnose 3,5-epimerase